MDLMNINMNVRVGGYTVVERGKQEGFFELCPFCSSCQTILFERYKVVKRVGQGNFSSVFLAQDLYIPSRSPVAVKIFHQQYADIGLAVPDGYYNIVFLYLVGRRLSVCGRWEGRIGLGRLEG